LNDPPVAGLDPNARSYPGRNGDILAIHIHGGFPDDGSHPALLLVINLVRAKMNHLPWIASVILFTVLYVSALDLHDVSHAKPSTAKTENSINRHATVMIFLN